MEAEVSNVISPRDAMWRALPNEASYLAAGKTVADTVRVVTHLANLEPKSILDYGSGHGRVLRWLQAYWPKAVLGAADVTPDQIGFCAETFGATPILLDKPFPDIELPRTYDLIWLGSIFTHIDATSWRELILSLRRYLTKGGVLCFSFAGRRMYRMIKDEEKGTFLDAESPEKVAALLSGYETEGFGFLPQWESNGRSWGRSVADLPWALNICLELGGKIVLLSEEAYAKRQDIVALRFK